jgi:hypothetical protein
VPEPRISTWGKISSNRAAPIGTAGHLRQNAVFFWILGALSVCSTAASAQMKILGERDTVAAAKLSAIEIDEIINAVKKSAYDVPKSWRAELRFRRVDLGIGPGIVVQGTRLLCGGTGNCQMWVFRKARAKWVSLFKNDQTILAEGFEFGPALKHHVKDLTVSTNFSADETRRVTYKFDGRRYTSR